MDKKITIECTMEEGCIKYLLSFLRRMEYNGNIGHTEVIAFYDDGDGDIRPRFLVDGKQLKEYDLPEPEMKKYVPHPQNIKLLEKKDNKEIYEFGQYDLRDLPMF